jgi:hypothetical protein
MSNQNFFERRKADAEVIVRGVGFLTSTSKLRLAIRAKKKDREKLMRTIGVSLYEIYQADGKLDSVKITNAAVPDLESIEAIDAELKELERHLQEANETFRNHGKGDKGEDDKGGSTSSS